MFVFGVRPGPALWSPWLQNPSVSPVRSLLYLDVGATENSSVPERSLLPMSSLPNSRPTSDESLQLPEAEHRIRGMTVPDRQEQLSFLGRMLPPGFEMRVVVVDPGDTRPYQEADWRDALVVVERGSIQLDSSCGRRDFVTGDVLCLVGLSLRALHNRGPEPAVLVAVSRKQ